MPSSHRASSISSTGTTSSRATIATTRRAQMAPARRAPTLAASLAPRPPAPKLKPVAVARNLVVMLEEQEAKEREHERVVAVLNQRIDRVVGALEESDDALAASEAARRTAEEARRAAEAALDEQKKKVASFEAANNDLKKANEELQRDLAEKDAALTALNEAVKLRRKADNIFDRWVV